MKTIKGPAIYLAQFVGDEAPFDTWDGITKWASGLGYVGVQVPTWDKRKIDMRPGSDFLAALDADRAPGDYELLAYTRLGDLIVGAENAAPPGEEAWWVANPPLSFAHLGAANDPRILADIARRLRGEEPISTSPPSPLPAPDHDLPSDAPRGPKLLTYEEDPLKAADADREGGGAANQDNVTRLRPGARRRRLAGSPPKPPFG